MTQSRENPELGFPGAHQAHGTPTRATQTGQSQHPVQVFWVLFKSPAAGVEDAFAVSCFYLMESISPSPVVCLAFPR